MPLHPVLRPPTRVSRLYPLMTLFLMIASSSLVYAWQNSQLTGDTALGERDRQIQTLSLQLEQLSAQSQLDRATLQTQQTQLDAAKSQLATTEEQLNTKTKALADANSQLQNQKSQLDANSAELENLRNRPPLFSFQNKSSLENIEAKQADIKELVTVAYDYIQNLYGRPYLLNSITITFVNSFSISGASGEIEISNGPQGISIDIHLKDFQKNSFEDVNTIIHEMIHGFHGIAVIDSSALEEGMTVAATDAVMAKMIADGKLPKFDRLYIAITDAQYQDFNRHLQVYANNDTFYQDSQISRVYQLIGKAWYGLYAQDPTFFKAFNEKYYATMQTGKKVDAAGIRDIIGSILTSVGGVPINSYLSANRAFNPS